jgi:hypothetical protein
MTREAEAAYEKLCEELEAAELVDAETDEEEWADALVQFIMRKQGISFIAGAEEERTFNHMEKTAAELRCERVDLSLARQLGQSIALNSSLRKELEMVKNQYGIFHQPKNTLPRIEQIWAVVSVDPEDGNEGVAAVELQSGVMMPLIAADEKRLEFIKPLAQQLANFTEMKLKLIRLSVREEVAEINAQPQPKP